MSFPYLVHNWRGFNGEPPPITPADGSEFKFCTTNRGSGTSFRSAVLAQSPQSFFDFADVDYTDGLENGSTVSNYGSSGAAFTTITDKAWVAPGEPMTTDGNPCISNTLRIQSDKTYFQCDTGLTRSDLGPDYELTHMFLVHMTENQENSGTIFQWGDIATGDVYELRLDASTQTLFNLTEIFGGANQGSLIYSVPTAAFFDQPCLIICRRFRSNSEPSNPVWRPAIHVFGANGAQYINLSGSSSGGFGDPSPEWPLSGGDTTFNYFGRRSGATWSLPLESTFGGAAFWTTDIGETAANALGAAFQAAAQDYWLGEIAARNVFCGSQAVNRFRPTGRQPFHPIAANPNETGECIMSDSGRADDCWYSTNYGVSWRPVAIGTSSETVTDLRWVNGGNGWVAKIGNTATGDIEDYYSSDLINWATLPAYVDARAAATGNNVNSWRWVQTQTRLFSIGREYAYGVDSAAITGTYDNFRDFVSNPYASFAEDFEPFLSASAISSQFWVDTGTTFTAWLNSDLNQVQQQQTPPTHKADPDTGWSSAATAGLGVAFGADTTVGSATVEFIRFGANDYDTNDANGTWTLDRPVCRSVPVLYDENLDLVDRTTVAVLSDPAEPGRSNLWMGSDDIVAGVFDWAGGARRFKVGLTARATEGTAEIVHLGHDKFLICYTGDRSGGTGKFTQVDLFTGLYMGDSFKIPDIPTTGGDLPELPDDNIRGDLYEAISPLAPDIFYRLDDPQPTTAIGNSVVDEGVKQYDNTLIGDPIGQITTTQAAVIATAPYAYYPLAGTGADVSGNNRSGTIIGSPEPTTAFERAPFTEGMRFKPSDRISIPGMSFFNDSSDATLMMWVGLPGDITITTGDSFEFFGNSTSAGTEGFGFYMEQGVAVGRVRLATSDGTTQVSALSPDAYEYSRAGGFTSTGFEGNVGMFPIIMRKSGTSLTFYRGYGSAQASVIKSADTGNPAQVYIGSIGDAALANTTTDVLMSHVAIWDRDIGDAAVKSLLRAMLNPAPDILLWDAAFDASTPGSADNSATISPGTVVLSTDNSSGSQGANAVIPFRLGDFDDLIIQFTRTDSGGAWFDDDLTDARFDVAINTIDEGSGTVDYFPFQLRNSGFSYTDWGTFDVNVRIGQAVNQILPVVSGTNDPATIYQNMLAGHNSGGVTYRIEFKRNTTHPQGAFGGWEVQVYQDNILIAEDFQGASSDNKEWVGYGVLGFHFHNYQPASPSVITVGNISASTNGNVLSPDYSLELAPLVADAGTSMSVNTGSGLLRTLDVQATSHTHIFIFDLAGVTDGETVFDNGNVTLTFLTGTIRLNGTDTTLDDTTRYLVVRQIGTEIKAYANNSLVPVATVTGSATALVNQEISGDGLRIDWYVLVPNNNATIEDIIGALDTEYPLDTYDQTVGLTPTDVTPALGGSALAGAQPESQLYPSAWHMRDDGFGIFFVNADPAQMYTTTDFGDTWTGPIDKSAQLTVWTGTDQKVVGHLMYDAGTYAIVVSQTSNRATSLATSTDDGANWTSIAGQYYGWGIDLSGSTLVQNSRNASSGGLGTTLVGNTTPGGLVTRHATSATDNGAGVVISGDGNVLMSLYQSPTRAVTTTGGFGSGYVDINPDPEFTWGWKYATIPGSGLIWGVTQRFTLGQPTAMALTQTDHLEQPQSNFRIGSAGYQASSGNLVRTFSFSDGDNNNNKKIHMELNATGGLSDWGNKFHINLLGSQHNHFFDGDRSRIMGAGQYWFYGYVRERDELNVIRDDVRLLRFEYPQVSALVVPPPPPDPSPPPTPSDPPAADPYLRMVLNAEDAVQFLGPSDPDAWRVPGTQEGLVNEVAGYPVGDVTDGSAYLGLISNTVFKFGTKSFKCLAGTSPYIGSSGQGFLDWPNNWRGFRSGFTNDLSGNKSWTIETWMTGAATGSTDMGTSMEYVNGYTANDKWYGGMTIKFVKTGSFFRCYLDLGPSLGNASLTDRPLKLQFQTAIASWSNTLFRHVAVQRIASTSSSDARYDVFVDGVQLEVVRQTGDINATVQRGTWKFGASETFNVKSGTRRLTVSPSYGNSDLRYGAKLTYSGVHFDSFRVTINDALYESSFTPPVAAYPSV